MIQCTVRFYQELNDFLPSDLKQRDIESSSFTTRSVKDLIESFGVPHVEVDLVLANGLSVDFDYLLQNNDRISVYPVFERLDIENTTRLRPKSLRNPSFVVDVHLKTLARRLRMLGFDTLYDPDLDDPDLAEVSCHERRILLTRDTQLLMRKVVTRGLYVRNTDPDKQAREIVERLDLYGRIRPFSRCILCNSSIEPIDSKTLSVESLTKIPQGVRAWCTEFYQCVGCDNVYWKGSHYKRMLAFIENVIRPRGNS